MAVSKQAGIFEAKTLELTDVADLAVAYVGYVVLGNLSIKVNPVGFYQVTKALIAPTILLINAVSTGEMPSKHIVASVTLLTSGIMVATVTDDQVMSNFLGLAVGLAYILSTATYNILAGRKQKALNAGANQLLHRFSPVAALLLTVAAPITEYLLATFEGPTKSGAAAPAFHASPAAIVVIAMSAALGLLVSLSTFLVIRHTSALTYNVVGHIKTVGIVAGGVLFYDEVMPAKKMAGLAAAAVGILWYSALSMNPAPTLPSATSAATVKPLISPSTPSGSSETKTPAADSTPLKDERSSESLSVLSLPSGTGTQLTGKPCDSSSPP